MAANGDVQPPRGARVYHDHAGAGGRSVMARPSAVATWAWFLVKNLLGWVLIVGAFPLGAFIPGPGGIPLFLVGFGLVSFPGKRGITARVLRGRPVPCDSPAFQYAVAVLAALLPAAAFAYLVQSGWIAVRRTPHFGLIVASAYALTAGTLWWIGLHSYGLLNWALARVPRMRRKVRPWLRRVGIDLLPPRRRKRHAEPHAFAVIANADGTRPRREPDPEILEIHPRHFKRFRRAWAVAKPWLRRVAGVAITAAIFWWIGRSIVENWHAVSSRMATIRWGTFFLTAGMFAVFLLAFRAVVWRRILRGFGHRVPLAPAVRIWSTSELARYLPGVIWQVVGRVYLVKPYGVRGSVCSASQVLELAIFLLANVLVAVACLVWLGIKEMDGPARAWMFVAMALVPVLVFLLHPRVLFRLINGVLRRLRKPPIEPRMGFAALAGLLLWSVAGLLWQSLAIWALVEEPLGGLQLAKWWVVAGAYCLAWVAGFLAVWAPGGLGVRELVFIAAMQFALPQVVHLRFQGDPDELVGVITFLSVLLRLWATAGELMLAGVAYLFDVPGALRGGGRPANRTSAATGEPLPSPFPPHRPDVGADNI
jgi:hypothetical protein